jgi:DNA (cytosine-5)-methyltransferase 1
VNVISLFTGVGGFDLGLERAGHRIIAQCEADANARKVLRRHWPDVPIHEDVCGLDGEWLASVGLAERCGDGSSSDNGAEHRNGDGSSGSDLSEPKSSRVFRGSGVGSRGDRVSGGRSTDPEGSGKREQSGSIGVDLVCGGFPCQDLSVAGKRAGLAGERSGLFFEAARISDLVLGDGGWVLIENVPGLLSSNGGADFGIVLATLADLGFHDLAWRVLDSRYFGVPQRRRRVFILARRARGRRAAEVLLEPEGGGGNHQASRETRALVASGTGPSIDRTGATQSLGTRFGNSGADLPDAEAGWLVAGATLSTKYGESAGQDLGQPGALVTDGGFREPTGRGQGHALRPTTDDRGREAGSGLPDDQGRADGPTPDPDGVRTTPGVSGRVDDPVTAFHAKQDPITGEGFTPALGATAAIGHNGRGEDRATCAYDPKPDGPRYAQMGNAVTVNVAEWIGHRLREFG